MGYVNMVKTLSIVTLTLNNLEYTKKYIDSLYRFTNDFELIIVDNASTDGTIDYLESLQLEKDNLKVIYNNENKGFSKGNNQGIDIAQGEYIGFLNNDILLYPNWFEKIKEVFENENAAFASPRHIKPDFNFTNEHSYIQYFQNFKYDKPYEKSFDECEFSCVITKKEILDKIGNFDENYTPAFFEDNDIKYRAIMAGYGVYVVNSVCFFHFGSATSVNYNDNFEANRAYYYSKYPLAEYLSISGEEKGDLKIKNRHFQNFPLNIAYNLYLLWLKIIKRIKRRRK